VRREFAEACDLLILESRDYPRAHPRDPPNREVIQQMHSHNIAALVRIDAISAEIIS
jgi:hypothetical protein